MNFVFESGHKNEKDARRVFEETKQDEDLGYMIGSMSFGRKKEFCALQAADMLAYWAYRDEVKPGIAPDNKGLHFIPEQEMSEAGLGVFKHHISRDDLENLRRNFYRFAKEPVFERINTVDERFMHGLPVLDKL
jgi:hypothetical protein